MTKIKNVWLNSCATKLDAITEANDRNDPDEINNLTNEIMEELYNVQDTINLLNKEIEFANDCITKLRESTTDIYEDMSGFVIESNKKYVKISVDQFFYITKPRKEKK